MRTSGCGVWVSSKTSWSAVPSSVIGCCNWTMGWTAIRSSSTSCGVQPRAALRSWELGARPWRSHSLVAAARSLLWRSMHVTRQPDRAVLLAEGPADGLANPPVGIGDKAQSAPRLELVHRTHEPQIAFLDQIEQGHPAVAIAMRDMNDEPQVGLHHLGFGLIQLLLGAGPGPRGGLQRGVLRLRPRTRPLTPRPSPPGRADATAGFRTLSATHATGGNARGGAPAVPAPPPTATPHVLLPADRDVR